MHVERNVGVAADLKGKRWEFDKATLGIPFQIKTGECGCQHLDNESWYLDRKRVRRCH